MCCGQHTIQSVEWSFPDGKTTMQVPQNERSPIDTAVVKQCLEKRPERWLLANGVEPDRYAERSDTNPSSCHTPSNDQRPAGMAISWLDSNHQQQVHRLRKLEIQRSPSCHPDTPGLGCQNQDLLEFFSSTNTRLTQCCTSGASNTSSVTLHEAVMRLGVTRNCGLLLLSKSR